MSREEFYLIASGLKAVYKIIDTKESFDVWFELLKDLDYDHASKATQMYMMQEHFPPTPADIRRKAAEMLTINSELTEGEAWGLVRQAISNGIYNSKSEFERLPEEIQRAVGTDKQLQIWAMDSDFNEGVAQSQFLRSYRQVKERSKELAVIPVKMRELIANTTGKMISERSDYEY